MPKKVLITLFCIVGAVLAIGCSDSEPEQTPTPVPTATATSVPEPTPSPTPVPSPTATPEPTATPRLDALFNYTAGVRLLQAGMYKEAIPRFGLVIRRLPDFAKAYYGRGRSYYEEELLGLALEDLDKAIELDPQLADAYKTRADVYKGQDEIEKAIADLEEAISLYDRIREARKLEEARQLMDELK